MQGLCLALALKQLNIPCDVYEKRSSSHKQGAAIILSPNALRILDSLGVYERIRKQGFNFKALTYKNEAGETTDAYYFGHAELYGYDSLRIDRHVVINALLAVLREHGTTVNYEKQFSHIISETAESVAFAFADGTEASAPFLIGADGVHSIVRKQIFPSSEATYSGMMAMIGQTETAKIRFPAENYDLPVHIAAKPGAFLIVPEDYSGSKTMAAMQKWFPGRDQAGWKELRANRREVLRIYRGELDQWPDVARSAIESVTAENLNIWPFYLAPNLQTWMSTTGRIIIIGDAAHAIPPSAGQGVNQAVEDSYMLALVLSKVSPRVPMARALEFWQTFRQERVEKVIELTAQVNARRLPLAEQAKLPPGAVWKDESEFKGEGGQLRWLYEPDLDKVVSSWVQGKTEGSW